MKDTDKGSLLRNLAEEKMDLEAAKEGFALRRLRKMTGRRRYAPSTGPVFRRWAPAEMDMEGAANRLPPR